MVAIANHPLRGITRAGHSPLRNPGEHAPLFMRNRLILERRSRDGRLFQRVVKEDNILTTYGLNNLIELLVSGTQAFSASNGWIRAVAIGTDTTAAVSTDTGLGNSTASHHISAASMVGSDAGNRSLQYNFTFDDNSAYTVNEVGLFGTNNATSRCIARNVLAASDQIVKGTGDVINGSYQIIAATG